MGFLLSFHYVQKQFFSAINIAYGPEITVHPNRTIRGIHIDRSLSSAVYMLR